MAAKKQLKNYQLAQSYHLTANVISYDACLFKLHQKLSFPGVLKLVAIKMWREFPERKPRWSFFLVFPPQAFPQFFLEFSRSFRTATLENISGRLAQ